MNSLFAPGSIWAGERVVVVAGGPSLSLRQVRYLGIARAAARCKVIAVSDAVYPCWFADIAYSSEARWFDLHRGVPGFRGVRVCREPSPYPDIAHMNVTGGEGFDEEPGNIRHGSNSGYQAVHLAAQLGAAEVVIVAMDFSDDGARDHWFGVHHGPFDLHSDTKEWRRKFRILTDDLARLGVKVRNASLASTITWLPTCRVEEALA